MTGEGKQGNSIQIGGFSDLDQSEVVVETEFGNSEPRTEKPVGDRGVLPV